VGVSLAGNIRSALDPNVTQRKKQKDRGRKKGKERKIKGKEKIDKGRE
jgi:hypothetical protein